MTAATRTQTHGWYRTYLALHETPAQRTERQLIQGPHAEAAAPCWECGTLSTSPICLYCAVDTVATPEQKARHL